MHMPYAAPHTDQPIMNDRPSADSSEIGSWSRRVVRLNERGNEIRRAFYLGRDLSYYEKERCRPCEGWHRFPTHEDAAWHGVFVHPERREIISFTEGGETKVVCHTTGGYRAELRHLVERFGVLLPPVLAPKASATAGRRRDAPARIRLDLAAVHSG
jgi:hypothetical protein